MSEAKHTPGPWKVRTVDESIGSIETQDGEIQVAYTCQVRSTDWKDNHSERRANTRLIAAAPDLLEALQAFVNQYGNSDIEKWIGVLNQAKSAIARATGKGE